MKKPSSTKLLLKRFLWSASAFWLADSGLAATLTVTNLNDSGAGSLRQAIQDAAPGDTIGFAVTGTIALTNGELLLTNNLSILGPGATNLALSGNNASRVFEIGSNSTVTMSGLTVTKGQATDYTNSIFGGRGGGIYNAGRLALADSVITGNSGASGYYLPGGNGGDGGGIYNAGTLTLTSCSVTANSSGEGSFAFPGGHGGSGGGIYNAGTLTLIGGTVAANSSGWGRIYGAGGAGGGIYNGGTLALSGCSISSNSGGLSREAAGPGGSGGGIYNAGMLELTSCILSNNAGGSEDIYGGPNVRGGSGGGICNAGSGTVALTACILSGNSGGTGSFGSSGGIDRVSYAGGDGGALCNWGVVTATNCTLSENKGGTGGAGSSSAGYSGGNGGDGGAVYNGGALILNRCTLASNFGGSGTSGRSGGFGTYSTSGGNGGNGGGIYNAGTFSSVSCTFKGNGGGNGGHGGDSTGGYGALGGSGGTGGAVYSAASLSMICCTLSANRAGDGGNGGNGSGGFQPYGGNGGNGGAAGGVFNATNSSLATLRNTLLAQNGGGLGGAGGQGIPNGSPGSAGPGPDLAGLFTSQGYNLIGQTNGATGFINGINDDLAGSSAAPLGPKLGPLQNNGGPTWTMALLPGSPAIDAGDDGLLDPPFNVSADQRGLPRRFGAHVDIGAFEFQAASLPIYLMGLAMLGNGGVQLAFTNTPGATFTLLAATDVSLPLSNWTALGPATEIAPGQFQFTDAQATNMSQRFYRLRSP